VNYSGSSIWGDKIYLLKYLVYIIKIMISMNMINAPLLHSSSRWSNLFVNRRKLPTARSIEKTTAKGTPNLKNLKA
jgi:hypothetical protein